MVRYIHECHCCGFGKEFASKKDMEQYRCQCNKQPLLTIELQDEISVPKVLYKGEEITNKVNVLFDWDTSNGLSPSGLTYAIEHIETGSKQLTSNRIERRCGDHASG